MTFQSFFSFGACLENDSMCSGPLCMCKYIFKDIFCVNIFLVFSCKAGEQRKCVYTTLNSVQFGKNVWLFF